MNEINQYRIDTFRMLLTLLHPDIPTKLVDEQIAAELALADAELYGKGESDE